jgi:hypothetical protein
LARFGVAAFEQAARFCCDGRVGIVVEMGTRNGVQGGTLHQAVLDRFQQERDAAAGGQQRADRTLAPGRAVCAPMVENYFPGGAKEPKLLDASPAAITLAMICTREQLEEKQR